MLPANVVLGLSFFAENAHLMSGASEVEQGRVSVQKSVKAGMFADWRRKGGKQEMEASRS